MVLVHPRQVSIATVPRWHHQLVQAMLATLTVGLRGTMVRAAFLHFGSWVLVVGGGTTIGCPASPYCASSLQFM